MGAEWPDGVDGERAPLGHTIMLAVEDGLGDTMRPRLEALGGDPARVEVVQGLRYNNIERALTLSQEVIPLLESRIEETGTALLVIDPLSAYLGKADSYKDAEVRGVLDPLAWMAAKTGAAIVGIMHLTKDEQRKALYRQSGSVAFTAVARAVFGVASDSEDPGRKIFACGKMNNGPMPPALAFRIEDGVPVGRFVWESTPSPGVTLNSLLGPETARDRRTDDDAAAVDAFLKEVLSHGPEPAKQVEETARSAHEFTKSQLRGGKKRLGIVTHRIGGIAGAGVWMWRLPGTPTNPA